MNSQNVIGLNRYHSLFSFLIILIITTSAPFMWKVIVPCSSRKMMPMRLVVEEKGNVCKISYFSSPSGLRKMMVCKSLLNSVTPKLSAAFTAENQSIHQFIHAPSAISSGEEA